MHNISLDSSIESTLIDIENDIAEISRILNEIYKAVLLLDDTKWKGPQKKKLEEQFLPYLKEIFEKYPIYLNNRLQFVKDAINKYKEINVEQEKNASILEDLS